MGDIDRMRGRHFPFDPDVDAAMQARFDVVIAQDPHAPDHDAVDEAVAALGARLLDRVSPNALAEWVERFAGQAIAILNVGALDEAAAFDCVEQVCEMCHSRGWPLLIACDRMQIDTASAAIAAAQAAGSARVQLLCEGAPSDWVAALALAAEGDPALGERLRESEAARLARLNEEVARIAEVLARLSRREPASGGSAQEHRPRFASAPPAAAITAAEVRDVIRARRLRERFFPSRLLEDPGWDMMLDLFAAHLERAQVSVSSLCIAAAVAPTTALRWIGKLTDVGLLMREPDPFDRRRAFMALTPEAREGMERYLAALADAGLRLA